MKNKKILIVTHQFLPHVSPRTTRWSLLIDELINKGNEVTVLTGTDPDNIQKNYKILYFGNKKFSSNINKIRQNSQNSSNNSIKKIGYEINLENEEMNNCLKNEKSQDEILNLICLNPSEV